MILARRPTERSFVSAVARGPTCSASSSTPSGAGGRPAAARQRRRAAAGRALARRGSPAASPPRSRLMLRRRVIPCLDVANGRVVKGTRFVDLVDEGDPPELAERYAAGGRRRAGLPRHHRGAGGPRHAPGHRRADGATGVHPAHRRRRRPERPRHARGPPGGRGQGLAEHGRGRRPHARLPLRRPLRPAGRRRRDRRPPPRDRPSRGDADAAPAWEVVVKGGRESTGLDAIAWAERVVDLGAGELLVTSIDRDGTRSGFDTALLRAITDRVRVPVIASGGAAGPDGLRRRDPRRRRRRRARRLDLPSAAPLDRRGQAGDGRRRPAGPARRGGRGMTQGADDPAAPEPLLGPERPRPRDRPGRRRRPGPDARLDGRGGLAGHPRDRRRPFPLADARPAVAEGRVVRPRARRPRRRPRLRRRRDPRRRRIRSGRPAIGTPGAASIRDARRPAPEPTDPGLRLAARDCWDDDRLPRGRAARTAPTRRACSTAAWTRSGGRSPRRRPRS